MARNVATIPTSIGHVFAVLATPETYAYWVVGSDSIRDADEEWPAVGAKLHHRLGVGPFKLNDNTEVVEVTAPVHLVLLARARPLGTARITLELSALGDDRTEVTMIELPGDRVSRFLHNRIADHLLGRRNAVALRRLGELAVQHQAADGGGGGA
jgi:uncharacterized protein YndB with AHSA1/START domain